MATAPINSTPLPTPPSTTDPGNFDARADAFLGALPTFQSQTNSQATTTYNNALAAEEAARVAELAGDRATDKATEALTSANNANIAKLAAEAALDSFDDRYLGAKSSDPALDNDGNPVVVGALYYRTTSPIGMKVKSASGWDDAYANLSSKYDKTGGDISGPVGVFGLLTAKSPSPGVAGKISFQDSTGGADLLIGKNDSLANWADINHSASGGTLRISQTGAGTISTLVNNTIVHETTTSGLQVLSGALGYGAGAGGAVTQLTSKSTAVTLNKACGQIIMSGESLASDASVSFIFNNSMLGEYDGVLIRPSGFSGYAVEVEYSATTTSVSVRVTNRGATRANALTLIFQIIKGTAS